MKIKTITDVIDKGGRIRETMMSNMQEDVRIEMTAQIAKWARHNNRKRTAKVGPNQCECWLRRSDGQEGEVIRLHEKKAVEIKQLHRIQNKNNKRKAPEAKEIWNTNGTEEINKNGKNTGNRKINLQLKPITNTSINQPNEKTMGECAIDRREIAELWDRTQNDTGHLEVVSDGSVKNKDMRGTYAWAILKRNNNNLQWTNVEGWGMDHIKTRNGRKYQYGIYTKQLHSYRMEAMGLLSGMIFLRYTLKWKGTVKWYLDSKSVIDTYTKNVNPQHTTKWLKQRDRDIWDSINIEKNCGQTDSH